MSFAAFLRSVVASTLWSPNIPVCAPFSNTHNLCAHSFVCLITRLCSMNTNFLNCTANTFVVGRRLRGFMWIAGRGGMPISRSILWQRSLFALLLFLAVRHIRLHEGQKWSYSILPNLNNRTSGNNRCLCYFESSNESRVEWKALFRDREFLVSYLGPETDILNQVMSPARQISGW
jgi:hypothetical protein